MVKQRLHPKWVVCLVLYALGLIAAFFLVGYHTMGLLLMGAGTLIPIYHCLGLLKKRRETMGRWATMLFTIALALGLTAMAVTCGIIVRSSRGTENPDSDYLVVLGAGVNGTAPSRSLRERLDAACDYLISHPDATAVVSGSQGNGEDISEAECMYRYLTEKGIDPSRIWKEELADNTLQNLRYSLDIIEAKTGLRPNKIAIVSSEYHLHRAGMFAGWLEVEAELIPAKTGIVPLRWNYYIREIFALWYYSLIGGTSYA